MLNSAIGSHGVAVPAAHEGLDGSSVTIHDAHFLFHADFKRTGSDLTLTGEDGHRVVVPDYFKHDKLPTLLSPEGAALTGDIIEALVGPRAAGQYAQAGGAPATVAPEIIGRVATASGGTTAVRNGVAVTLNQGDAVYKGCQRRSKDASAGRSKSTSMVLARRPPNWGPFRHASGWVG